MIYTGYFSCLKKYKQYGLIPIAICGRYPEFFKHGYWFKFFAPSWDIFSNWKNGKINNDQYTTRFNEEILGNISSVDKENLIKFFTQKDKSFILLCYEKPSDFCHRHLVADYIRNVLHLPCEEFLK